MFVFFFFLFVFFFFNDTATTEIYTLSLHDALPIYFATGALDVDQAAAVVDGIAEGCVRSGTALIGGETAEMPGMYAAGDRKSTRLNSSHVRTSRMPSSA